MSITWEASRFVEAAGDANTPDDHVQDAAQELYVKLCSAPPEDVAAVLEVLAPGIAQTAHPERAGLVAMLCGALVERGGDPAPVAGPMLERLRRVAPPARELRDAALAAIPAGSSGEDPGQSAEAFDAARQAVAPHMPEQSAAWDLLERLFPPAIAALSASAAVRARGRDLLPVMSDLAAHHAGAHWIAKVLRVLDREPFVAIEPATGLGIAGSFGGVSENFQLNALLMDAFPRVDGTPRRIDAEAADIARGAGPQQGEQVVTGAWNLYAWQAAGPGGALPDASEQGEHWIWNEGTPADIPAHRGVRVILLGPASYERTWRAQRDFAALRANLTIDRRLTAHEVRRVLNRMARER